jgi:hypothetical protein
MSDERPGRCWWLRPIEDHGCTWGDLRDRTLHVFATKTTYVAEQAGHSIATLARHYAGTLRELETKPRVPAAEAIRQAREEVWGTH